MSGKKNITINAECIASNSIFIKSNFSLKLDFLKIEFQNKDILLLVLGKKDKCPFWPAKSVMIVRNINPSLFSFSMFLSINKHDLPLE